MTGKHVLQGRGKQALITGAAGVLLGLPLTLSAGDAPAPVQVAPLPPATSAAPITQTAGPAAPQFRSQQYNNEVQRQLELLYQQDPNTAGQPNLPKPPAGPTGVSSMGTDGGRIVISGIVGGGTDDGQACPGGGLAGAAGGGVRPCGAGAGPAVTLAGGAEVTP